MFKTLVIKELKAIILSPKFSVTFAVCSGLILLSFYAGIKEYQSAMRNWETASSLADQQAAESTSWRTFNYQTLRKPDPMMILVSGLTNDIGRWSNIATDESVKLRHSPYSDDPIYAVFRMIDFSFITLVVLTLFAILFTYDSINGERESGTLKLTLSNAVPRATFLRAKIAGAWLGLGGPILAPIFAGLLLVVLMGVPLTATHWSKITVLIVLSLLLFTLFITLGTLISSLTRRSSVSFLFSLIMWLVFVMIIPRASVMAAGAILPVPRVAEIEGQRDGYAKGLWEEFYKDMEERLQTDRASGLDIDDDAAMWARMEREDSLRKAIEAKIERYESKLFDELERRKAAREKLAFTLSRFSPASAYQLAVTSIAGTDITLKSRYQRAMSEYRQQWNKFVEGKREETEDHGGFVSISISSEDGLKIGTGDEKDGIDISQMPRFQPPEQSLAEVISPVILDFGILGAGIILAFVGAFFGFVRFDVR